MRNKFQFFLVLSTAGVLLLITACKKAPEKPNILFITTDYQAWEDVPELTPVLKMPTVDKLYKESVVFENHYCTAPICMPSRHSIITGTYPHTNGSFDNGPKWPREDDLNMMDELRKIGYKTVNVGKIHFNPWNQMGGFDLRIFAEATGNSAYDTLKKDDYANYLAKAGKTRWDYLKYQDSTELYGVYDWPLHDTLDIDYFVGDQSVKLIEKKAVNEEQPWFMWVSFNGPHNPWHPTKELSDYYLNQSLPKARYQENELNDKPVDHTTLRYNYTRKLADQFDQNPQKRNEYIQRIRAGHYGGLTAIDNQIARILESLRQSGMLENTIVVFSTDHGASLGDHDLFHKGTAYERSAHVPFFVWQPDRYEKRKISGYTEHVDIFPTFLEMGGGSLPSGLEGKSLAPELAGTGNGDDRAFIEIFNDYSMVTDEFKFGLYTPFEEGELYDRTNDPDEFNNLYFDEAYRKVVDSLTNELLEFHPPLKMILAQRQPLKDPITEVSLIQGEQLSGINLPFFPGNPLHVVLNAALSEKATGPLITHQVGNTHGFCLFVKNGALYFSIRTFYEDHEYLLKKEIPAGTSRIVLDIDTNGGLKASVNGRETTHQTLWPIVRQPGRIEVQSGVLRAGVHGGNWFKPFGDLLKTDTLNGTIQKAFIAPKQN